MRLEIQGLGIEIKKLQISITDFDSKIFILQGRLAATNETAVFISHQVEVLQPAVASLDHLIRSLNVTPIAERIVLLDNRVSGWSSQIVSTNQAVHQLVGDVVVVREGIVGQYLNYTNRVVAMYANYANQIQLLDTAYTRHIDTSTTNFTQRINVVTTDYAIQIGLRFMEYTNQIDSLAIFYSTLSAGLFANYTDRTSVIYNSLLNYTSSIELHQPELLFFPTPLDTSYDDPAFACGTDGATRIGNKTCSVAPKTAWRPPSGFMEFNLTKSTVVHFEASSSAVCGSVYNCGYLTYLYIDSLYSIALVAPLSPLPL